MVVFVRNAIEIVVENIIKLHDNTSLLLLDQIQSSHFISFSHSNHSRRYTYTEYLVSVVQIYLQFLQIIYVLQVY